MAAALAESKATSERIMSEIASLKQDVVKMHKSIEARELKQPIISNEAEAADMATQPAIQASTTKLRQLTWRPNLHKGGTRLAGLERTLHGNREFRRVCRSFSREYENNKPISDVDFIWKFIDSIDLCLSKHIQESLAAGLSNYVYTRKQIRGQSDEHYVTISRKLSWDIFRKALDKIAMFSA
ncbi:hypothetical protein B0T26DRAFT_680881 [Lasiosphaeria miniovina]|uniref:Uncharacterized protein n=1 Tax=Lasiosphaeria miniovina TaxID=1954250 RepID=A0AA39ZTD3_9PEZI|nr:uncharacterized protein B0T26DRAFT_680881 [Lasiosphaeria miniovina]KAK0703149.1 hypothetical protein B0T26DRAFT_680881 [Lasiosphaeria miniovina]